MSIPKKIHYCWFGRNPKPELALKCITSWKKHCPDYEIIEWNEDNFDISACPLYVRQAYEMKKWPFVTDYVRLKVVYDYGGIYMDTDVELRKSLDSLLGYHAYFGFEDGKNINTGLGFGAVKGACILQELMADYQQIPFIQSDGTLDGTTCPMRNTQVFLRWGLVQDNSRQVLHKTVLILPSEYMCPIDYRTGIIKKSRNTISIHWFAASWQTSDQRKKEMEYQRARRRKVMQDYIVHIPNHILRKCLGEKNYDGIKTLLKRSKH